MEEGYEEENSSRCNKDKKSLDTCSWSALYVTRERKSSDAVARTDAASHAAASKAGVGLSRVAAVSTATPTSARSACGHGAGAAGEGRVSRSVL